MHAREEGSISKEDGLAMAEIEALFAAYDELAKDPVALRRQLEADLLAKHGQEWMDRNRKSLDETWDCSYQLLG